MDNFTAAAIQRRLRAMENPRDAAVLQGFFKTGPGQYGEGDRFLGLRVPVLRRVAGEFRGLPLSETAALLRSPWHEERLAALLILVRQADRGDEALRKAAYRLYLDHTRWINNWDLVDLSAPQLVGAYLADRRRTPLGRLARSTWLWDRRIAIVATLHFIRRHDFGTTLQIASLLQGDHEDLIHKAVGWMLREVGKRDLDALERFLDEHAATMPRTMLRYAIERHPPSRRAAWMSRGPARRPQRAP